MGDRTEVFYTPEARNAIREMIASEGFYVLTERLRHEIYTLQLQTLEAAQTWDQVLEARGFAKALAFLTNYEQFLDAEEAAGEGEGDV